MIDLIKEVSIDEANMNRITNVVIKETGIGFDLLKDSSRKRPIVIARHTAMYFIRLNNPEISLNKIGEYFGNRDHSSVIHAITSICDLFNTNKTFSANLIKICNDINPSLVSKLGQIVKYERSSI